MSTPLPGLSLTLNRFQWEGRHGTVVVQTLGPDGYAVRETWVDHRRTLTLRPTRYTRVGPENKPGTRPDSIPNRRD